MKELIEALQIFYTYNKSAYPTTCEHDVLYVNTVSPKIVTGGDIAKLKELGFEPDFENDYFYSFKYGSN